MVKRELLYLHILLIALEESGNTLEFELVFISE